MGLLINQLDEHNEGNILATIRYKVSEVIFIRQKEQIDLIDNIKSYYEKNFPMVKMYDVIIEEGEIDKLSDLINKNKGDELIVNLTGGKRINSLTLLELSIKNNIKAIYTDIKNKKIYTFNNGIDLTYEEFDDLDINDIINAAGGALVEDSSDLCKKKDLIYLSEQIYKNLDIWNKYKQRLYDTNIFKHIEESPDKIQINIKSLTEEEKLILKNILKKLKEMDELQYDEKNDDIEVTFLNKYIKGFIFKSGTWLEIATNNLINKIKEIDESRNGVVFLWSNENRTVRNEVDVVAVKDSVPIIISCKDSEKYNEMALNELNVYANKLGGKNAYKILVATREPFKGPVSIRAKEMGIHIVIFDGNENKFISNIKAIIDK
ncbi:MAG: DUF1887 family CARF protein [Clostridium sp.]|nr:DUF1887 family CARF protein [Clostridium sp.]